MMRDPDVVFLIGADEHIYPISASGRTAWESIWNLPFLKTDSGRSARRCKLTFVVFATMWMHNIALQQNLGGK